MDSTEMENALKENAAYEDRLRGLYDKLYAEVNMVSMALEKVNRWFKEIEDEFEEIRRMK